MSGLIRVLELLVMSQKSPWVMQGKKHTGTPLRDFNKDHILSRKYQEIIQTRCQHR